MEEKLKRAALRLQEVEMLLSQPEVYADPARLRDLNREQKELAPVVTAFRELEAARDMQREAEGMLSDPELRDLAHKADEVARRVHGFQANICLNYGGRDEILHAARACVAAGEELTEENFEKHLYSAGIPDPELIIRPSGELRLSNFLLWQCAYSEFYFCDTLWPDFTEADLDAAIVAYQKRDRRFGGVK